MSLRPSLSRRADVTCWVFGFKCLAQGHKHSRRAMLNECFSKPLHIFLFLLPCHIQIGRSRVLNYLRSYIGPRRTDLGMFLNVFATVSMIISDFFIYILHCSCFVLSNWAVMWVNSLFQLIIYFQSFNDLINENKEKRMIECTFLLPMIVKKFGSCD